MPAKTEKRCVTNADGKIDCSSAALGISKKFTLGRTIVGDTSVPSVAEHAALPGVQGAASPPTAEGNELTEDQQWAKLALIVEVAEEIWS